MVTAIIFDCFGVLTTDPWQEFLENLPSGVDREAVRDIHRAYSAGLITKEESTSRIQELAGQPFAEPEDTHNGLAKNTPLIAYIRQLKQHGYKLAILSNIGTNWIRDSLLSKDEQTLFDDMIFSHEVGLVKPDRRIFQLACQRLNVPPAKAVLIDDIERYCTAAREEGMQAILYHDFKQLKHDLQPLLMTK